MFPFFFSEQHNINFFVKEKVVIVYAINLSVFQTLKVLKLPRYVMRRVDKGGKD